MSQQQAANICQLCNNQGHFDYQCQFAGDFLARTQQAFNKGRQYYHQDGQGQWSQGDNDNENLLHFTDHQFLKQYTHLANRLYAHIQIKNVTRSRCNYDRKV